MKKYHITIDTDWCPDFMIEEVLDILDGTNVKCTFFVTNKSDMIKEILRKKHEVGIHPNFLINSSHGKNHNKIIEKLINLAPNTKYVRTHCLHQNTYILYNIFKNFPQIKLDLSTLTYKFSYVSKFSIPFNGTLISRINYNWEDSIAIHDKNFNWEKLNFYAEKNIFNFHPIQIFLNNYRQSNYEMYKKKFSKTKYYRVKKNNCIELIQNKKKGTKDFFKLLVNSNNKKIKLGDI